jgi:hypothetical protein
MSRTLLMHDVKLRAKTKSFWKTRTGHHQRQEINRLGGLNLPKFEVVIGSKHCAKASINHGAARRMVCAVASGHYYAFCNSQASLSTGCRCSLTTLLCRSQHDQWDADCYQCQIWSYWENRLGSSLLLTSSKSLTKLLRDIPRVSTSSRTTWTGIPACFIWSRSLWG